MKCATCRKSIEHPYYLDGKIYGYNCYKMAVALKYAKMQEIKNEDYARKCASAIEVFSNKTFKDSWNKDFQISILNQWNECKKLTGKQLDLIIKKFNEVETIEYYLTYIEISRQFSDRASKDNEFLIHLLNSNMLKHFKHDERIHDFYRDINASAIKRHNIKYYIVEYKDIDDKESICAILEQRIYQSIESDEFYEVIEAITI